MEQVKTDLIKAFALVILCCAASTARNISVLSEGQENRARLRYVIIETSVTDADNAELASRHVEVLMDSRAFSEKDLRLAPQRTLDAPRLPTLV